MAKTLNIHGINTVNFERAGTAFALTIGYSWKSPVTKVSEARRVVLYFDQWWHLRQIGREAWKLFESWRTSVTEELERVRKALEGKE